MTSNSINKYYLLIAFVFVLVFINKSENAISSNTPILLLEGKTLELVCNSSDSSPSDWLWKKDGTVLNDYLDVSEKERISAKGGVLTISKADKRDIGDWTCIEQRTSTQENIVVYARPYLLPFEEFQKTNYKSANIIEGERFSLRCQVMEGYTKKAYLQWFKYNESEHDNPNKNLVPLADEGPTGHVRINSSNSIDQTLTIDKVVPSDRFYYVCMSHNGNISFNNTILLRVKDKLGALWPFLGIVAEVIILCTIIFIYEKRRIKPDFDDSDNDNATDPKSTQDRSKSQDVRQRK